MAARVDLEPLQPQTAAAVVGPPEPAPRELEPPGLAALAALALAQQGSVCSALHKLTTANSSSGDIHFYIYIAL
jgi:hypothetical protein